MIRAGIVALLSGLALTGCGTPAPLAPTASAPAVAQQVAVPVSISIPALHVVAPIVDEGLDPQGAMAIPAVSETGWFDLGPRPGAPGAAVVVGHVNYDGVPGAFVHLDQLKVGDQATVTDKAGLEHLFTVYDTAEIPKVDYAARTVPLVFGARSTTELELVTCGGQVTDHEYADNVVVSLRAT